MRSKLQKFAEFANNLLPHEADFLLSVERFEDEERLSILKQVAENCRKITGHYPYNEEIDKRKFSYLKSWIEERLAAIDVDAQYEWLCSTEVQLMRDALTPQAEKQLLRLFAHSSATDFNFIKLYSLGRHFRHFLQIRMRHSDHAAVEEFLQNHATAFSYAQEVNDKLHQATADIVGQYSKGNADSMHWEQWLNGVFFDEYLDGYNRLLAFVRLIFVAYNYRRFDLLPDKLEYLESQFRLGKFYSRRIVANFYSQRLLACARANDFEQAEYYGFLSVRSHNSDYLYYANNLAAMLLRNGKAKEALAALRNALSEARETHNFHTKIGHAAYLIRALNQCGQFRQAETHAQTFFNAFKKEILELRWHLFFTAWFESLAAQGEFAKLQKLAATYDLVVRDKDYQKSPNYTPTIPWLLAIAAYKTGKTGARQVSSLFYDQLETFAIDHNLPAAFGDLVALAHQCVPEVMKEVNNLLQKKGVILKY